MRPASNLLYLVLFTLCAGFCSTGYAQQPTTNAPPAPAPASAPSTNNTPSEPPVDSATLAIRETMQLLIQGHLDDAMTKVNSVIQADPKNANAYFMRGNVYAQKKLWDQAQKDYETTIQLDSKNSLAKFNLAEVKFVEKKYDAARTGFDALKSDSDWGDVAVYKVFLCDLFGGHEDVASKELDAFNKVGTNASYYFANAAWDLFHKKTEDARTWFRSISNIYGPQKIDLYAASLKELGYLPLPPVPSASTDAK